MKNRIICFLICVFTILSTGCFGPSKPDAATLEKSFLTKMAPAAMGNIKIDKTTILKYEGRWAKARLTSQGESSVEYFFYEDGKWQYCLLVAGMDIDTAKKLKVPKPLWPTEEELKINKE
jgi:hypothetical protein